MARSDPVGPVPVGRRPHLPRRPAAGRQRLQVVLVLQGVHRRPEALVRIGDQLAALDQALERLFDELFAVVDVVEDLAAEDEEPAVDPELRAGDVLDPADELASESATVWNE